MCSGMLRSEAGLWRRSLRGVGIYELDFGDWMSI